MIIDANVLVYAVDEESPHHAPAKAFLELHLNGERRIGLPWQSLSAFLRITTHPRIMRTPLAAVEATGFVDDWLGAPAAWVPEMTASTWPILRDLIVTHRVAGNLVPDAQLAAIAIHHGVPVVSADTDFALFPDVVWLNPFG